MFSSYDKTRLTHADIGNWEDRIEKLYETPFVDSIEDVPNPERLARDSQLVITRLFIDSLMVLSFEEFSTIQAVLAIQQHWDSRPFPAYDSGGDSKQHPPVPLRLNLLEKMLDTDKSKLASLMASAIAKLPVLKLLIGQEILSDIDAAETSEVVDRLPTIKGIEDLKMIGQMIRKEFTKSMGKLYRTSELKSELRKKGK